MTQTKCCPIFKFGSWWCLTVHLDLLGYLFAGTVPWCWFSLCVAGFRVRDASEYFVYIRTQTRPAIEFVSGEEGRRPLRVRLQGRSELCKFIFVGTSAGIGDCFRV